MSGQQYFKIAICNKYQTLLEECESALAIWNGYRAEISESRLASKEAGDELLRLQAKYARAYTVLQNHAHNCSFCRWVANLEGRALENESHPCLPVIGLSSGKPSPLAARRRAAKASAIFFRASCVDVNRSEGLDDTTWLFLCA
jgi:hypothetical protein